MPRSQGTSRKGKPGKHERAMGFGKSLQRAHGQRYKPRANGKSSNGGMAMQPGVESIGVTEDRGGHTKSVLELQHIDDFLLQADLANREFVSERQGLVVLDATGQAYQPGPGHQNNVPKRTEFNFVELSVPRRPQWDQTTTPEQLEERERTAFLDWRRAIASKEEEIMRMGSATTTTVTPFEKNIEVWRQLWRVLERSGCLLQLVDARNPLFYLSDDLRDYATSLGKPMMVLVNKSDYLSIKQRHAWNDYLVQRGWEPLFFSAVKEQKKLDKAAQERRREERESGDPGFGQELEETDDDESNKSTEQEEVRKLDEPIPSEDGKGISEPLTREQLMEAMMAFARKNGCRPDERYDNRIQFGMVGFPNVGKSSVINVLVGSSKHEHGVVRVGVASQPGKTKHFQTIFIPDNDDMMLCDCPGLVFPSFVSNTADLIAAGVYPIAQMRDHWPVINLICQRIPREIINANYGIQLKAPTGQEMRELRLTDVPPPTAEEFLTTFCIARSMLAASSGAPDFPRAARLVIRDYAEGRLLYCHPPPGSDEDTFACETLSTALENTARLREKLLKQKAKEEADEKDKPPDRSDGSLNADPEFDDSDILFALMDDSNDHMRPARDARSKHKCHKKQKGGKKGKKKERHSDPYGCHTSPDELLLEQVASSGVVVNAGKYGHGGYTRPSGYSGAKGAL